MIDTIDIVESTLMDETGHCYSFLSSLCKVNKQVNINLWINRDANLKFSEQDVSINRYFYRRIRRLQSYYLYKKLLAGQNKLFLSTAGIIDLILLNWAAKETISTGKVYLYFHWFNITQKKLARLKKIAKQQPNILILGPTASVIDIFLNSGFKNSRIVPYPISANILNNQATENTFIRLLYAGAARQEKGITAVVDLIEHMNMVGLDIPISVQNSADHHGKYCAATKRDIKRLDNIHYPYLQLIRETLKPEEYARLFSGAISIQLYDASKFQDRISGVTLDALSAGSPIVATAGTWTAKMVDRFNAGVIIDDLKPSKIVSAIEVIISRYADYSKNACIGGLRLQRENNAEYLFDTLIETEAHQS